MADYHPVHAIARKRDVYGRRTRIGCLYVARRRHAHADAAGGARKKPIMPGQTLLIVVLAVLFGLTLVELWNRE
ncbi:MAG: hypothetical protein IIC02_09570 [Planctomycetes bacterium]|nr:hypothetical protein [Planctomycetota bacterium]